MAWHYHTLEILISPVTQRLWFSAAAIDATILLASGPRIRVGKGR